MKRNFRFYFALFFAKCTALVLKLIGRRGTSMPGSWAIILCPDFLGRMPRPKTVIGITGTNGKTTVSNLVADTLTANGYNFTNNKFGTNVQTGVASSLIANSTFWGKPKNDLALFELDERSFPKIVPYIKPDILLVTNIFQDSYKRNAHTEFILNLLNQSITKETKILINADDLLCSGIATENERKFFGMEKLVGEDSSDKNIICEVNHCQRCGGSLDWDFIRYYHIGQATCSECGWTNPKADYKVTSIDPDKMKMTLQTANGEEVYPLPNSNPINVYNSLAAIALLQEIGVLPSEILNAMQNIKISQARYNEEMIGGKKVILHLAKGQNPVACSLAFQNVKNYPGKKVILMFPHDRYDEISTVESPSWLYDTDYEFLNQPDILQIVVGGVLHAEVYVRMLLAGIPDEKILHFRDGECAGSHLKLDEAETVFILYDMYNTQLVNKGKDDIRAMLGVL